MYTPSIKFDKNVLSIVDQTLLPEELKYIKINSLDDSIDAIKSLKIRGAPAIGILAAYTIYLLAFINRSMQLSELIPILDSASEQLIASRPTAVNLSWAVNRMKSVYSKTTSNNIHSLLQDLEAAAISIHKEDEEFCYRIGNNGLQFLYDNCNILTLCNTGSLATGGWGTALGIIYAAQEKGLNIHVYVSETRPLGQGARLTLWELINHKIPCTLITDNMAASLMMQKKIGIVIFGADRIARNGDVANKIGSYNLAVLADYHKIPCIVAAPSSTFDLNIEHGSQIPIEYRDKSEILKFYNYSPGFVSAEQVYNPAFDVTPSQMLTGIVTEKGVLRQPIAYNINRYIKI